METFLVLILGILTVLFIYSFLLLFIKVRSYALLFVALLPLISFTLSKLISESDFNFSVFTTATVLGIILAAFIGYLLRNRLE